MQKPSPKLKAKIAVCRVMPIKSARGVMMGITAAACPLPEVRNTLIMVLARSMAGPCKKVLRAMSAAEIFRPGGAPC